MLEKLKEAIEQHDRNNADMLRLQSYRNHAEGEYTGVCVFISDFMESGSYKYSDVGKKIHEVLAKKLKVAVLETIDEFLPAMMKESETRYKELVENMKTIVNDTCKKCGYYRVHCNGLCFECGSKLSLNGKMKWEIE